MKARKFNSLSNSQKREVAGLVDPPASDFESFEQTVLIKLAGIKIKIKVQERDFKEIREIVREQLNLAENDFF
jgi:hypothetical protein